MTWLRPVFLLAIWSMLHDAIASGLERVQYRHPGLAVDLGVGLWAWPVPVDADGDGDMDLIVSCPDKPYNGVWLFENPDGQVKFPVFKPARRLSSTVHYVSPSYVNGQLRVLSPGREHPDFVRSGLERSVDLPVPSVAEIHQLRFKPGSDVSKIRHHQWKYVDFDGDGRLDLTVAVEDWAHYGWDNAWDTSGRWTNGPLHGIIYVLRNLGTTEMPRYTAPEALEAGGKWLDVFGCPSPNFADFDGDGDLDLLCGEFLDGLTYFENLGTRHAPRYAAGRRLRLSNGDSLRMDLEMIVPVAFDWDGDGDLDLVVGDEDGRVALVENTGRWNSGVPMFLAPHYFQQQADELKCGALATPVGTDWDSDGDIDIVCGNTAGYIQWFENLSGQGVERPSFAAPRFLSAHGKTIRFMAGKNGSIQGPCEAKWGYTTLSVADWDGDGRLDLVVNSILGEVVWFRNAGLPGRPELQSARPVRVDWGRGRRAPDLAWGWRRAKGPQLLTQWRTTPFAVDWNRDGQMDLVMLDNEGYLAWFEGIPGTRNNVLRPGCRVFEDHQGDPLRLTSGAAGKSGRRKLCIVDWDGDGRLDLLLNGENANYWRQLQAGSAGVRFQDMGKLAEKNVASHDVSPTVVDWNNDGVPDLLAGAEDGHLYYLRNPRSSPVPAR